MDSWQVIVVTRGKQLNSCSREIDVSEAIWDSVAFNVKINPVVNFDWENKCYIGNLVAVHLNRAHVAYVLRGRAGGNVRIFNRKTAERALLKGFVGKIVDISFAFTSSVILGIVDEVGAVYIFDISEQPDGKLSTSIRLQCNRPSDTPSSDYHRLVWCTYVPDSVESVGTSDDASMLLMVTHDNIAEVWNVDQAAHPEATFVASVLATHFGRKTISEHTQLIGHPLHQKHSFSEWTMRTDWRLHKNVPIVDVVFSPDGLHVATASLDGFVKFYELGREDQIEPRCEQNWQPHGGKPVSCIIFLDNLKNQNADTFWSFLITGTANNHEVKIWSSQDWSCLQTITLLEPLEINSLFESSPVVSSTTVKPYIKVKLDLSAAYLVLSDISRKVLYVFQLHQDHDAGIAHVSSVSEFLLSQPILSLALLDAGRRRLVKANEYAAELAWSCTTGEVVPEDDETEVPADDRGSDVGVLVQLYAIHTKAMQELLIRFQPESSVGPLPSSCSSTSDAITGMRDPLSDLSVYSDFERNGNSHHGGTPTHRLSTSSSSQHGDFSFSCNHATEQPLLLTPEAFSSIRASEETLCDVQDTINTISSSLTLVTDIDEDTGHKIDIRGQLLLSDFDNTTDPKSLLPVEPMDLFPSSRAERLSREQSPDHQLLVDLVNSSSVMLERTSRSELGNSESSASSSGASAELTEILESARHSDGLDIQQQSASEGVYNDDDTGSGEEEEEGDGNDDELNADGICQFRKSNWEAVITKGETSPYSEQARLTTQKPRGSDQELAVVDTRVIQDMQRSLKLIVQQLQRQQTEIEQLTNSLCRQSQVSDAVDRLTLHVESMENKILSRLTDHFHQHTRSDYTMPILQADSAPMCTTTVAEPRTSSTATPPTSLDETVAEGWRRALSELEARSRELHSKLEATCAHSVAEAVRTHLERIVRTEINNAVLPRVAEILDPVKDQLHNELAQKLTATDVLLKDNISKLVRSKQTMEVLSQATTSCMQSSMASVSRDILLPSFDRACQNMFQQLAVTFQRGSQEYMQQMESQMQQVQRRREETRDPVLNQLKAVTETLQRREQAQEPIHDRLTGAVESLKLTNAQMAASSDELEGKLLKKINGLHESLLNQLKQVVQHEVSTAVRQQQASLTERLEQALRSGAATPIHSEHRADTQQMQSQIALLIRQGKTNQAFQQALSATDLALVVYVCGSVDPDALFTDSCPLTQPVLLSLIQQLAVHFESDIELKHRYLQDAVMKLDQSNPVTREHSAAVVSKVISRLTSYLQTANSKDPMYTSMKRLRTMYEFVLRGFNQV